MAIINLFSEVDKMSKKHMIYFINSFLKVYIYVKYQSSNFSKSKALLKFDAHTHAHKHKPKTIYPQSSIQGVVGGGIGNLLSILIFMYLSLKIV